MGRREILAAVAIMVAGATLRGEEDAGTTIPDLMQTDPRGKFEGGGENYCGPVAVSNSLMAMFRENLAVEGVTQCELVRKLASPFYMGTHVKRGTDLEPLLSGVEHYLRDCGEKGYYLKYQGWRRHQRRFTTGISAPQLDWIKQTLEGEGAVWLHVGFYRREEAEDQYRRLCGHWVTAVGSGRDEQGEPAPEVIVVHDPSPRAGRGPSQEVLVLTQLESGTLVGTPRNLPRPAKGLYRIRKGLPLPSRAAIAILDGAVALRLRNRAPEGDQPDGAVLP